MLAIHEGRVTLPASCGAALKVVAAHQRGDRADGSFPASCGAALKASLAAERDALRE